MTRPFDGILLKGGATVKLKITLKKMPAWKQDFLEADFNYFRADCKFEICKHISKMTTDRNFAGKIFGMIQRRSSMVNASLDNFLASLEVLKEYNVFTYEINHDGTTSTVTLDMNDDYFDAIAMIRKANPLLQMGYSKKKFVAHLEKNLRKTYTKKLTVTEE
jgi:hypothetical protein